MAVRGSVKFLPMGGILDRYLAQGFLEFLSLVWLVSRRFIWSSIFLTASVILSTVEPQ